MVGFFRLPSAFTRNVLLNSAKVSGLLREGFVLHNCIAGESILFFSVFIRSMEQFHVVYMYQWIEIMLL